MTPIPIIDDISIYFFHNGILFFNLKRILSKFQGRFSKDYMCSLNFNTAFLDNK